VVLHCLLSDGREVGMCHGFFRSESFLELISVGLKQKGAITYLMIVS
jgi:hypothetical protein